MTNSCSESTFYLSINNENKTSTEVTVLAGSSNTIRYTSESISTDSVAATVQLYKKDSDADILVDDYGSTTFTIESNNLNKQYSENCESVETKYFITITSTNHTTCPNTSVAVTFTITDSDNKYYNYNNLGTYDISNDKFKVNEYISYDDSTNTIKVTTSGTDGDTATLTIKVGDTNETVTITNKITYTCGGIEEV